MFHISARRWVVSIVPHFIVFTLSCEEDVKSVCIYYIYVGSVTMWTIHVLMQLYVLRGLAVPVRGQVTKKTLNVWLMIHVLEIILISKGIKEKRIAQNTFDLKIMYRLTVIFVNCLIWQRKNTINIKLFLKMAGPGNAFLVCLRQKKMGNDIARITCLSLTIVYLQRP